MAATAALWLAISTPGASRSGLSGLPIPGSCGATPECSGQSLRPPGIDQAAWSEPADVLQGPNTLDSLIAGADWLVDGLLGTGLTRPVEGPLKAAVEAMNRSGKPILALDIPSGLDADTGVPQGIAVRATATATFVAPKLGFACPGASQYTGQVAVIDIGLPRACLRPFLT